MCTQRRRGENAAENPQIEPRTDDTTPGPKEVRYKNKQKKTDSTQGNTQSVVGGGGRGILDGIQKTRERGQGKNLGRPTPLGMGGPRT